MCIDSGSNKLSRFTQTNEEPNDLKDQLCAITEGLRTLTRIVHPQNTMMILNTLKNYNLSEDLKTQVSQHCIMHVNK